MVQRASKPTPDEWYDSAKAHAASLPSRHPCCTDGASIGVSRQDNIKKSLPSVMMAIPKLPVVEITS
jgi:hypothetical protein